ncbi:MAG: chorismate-binding protein [Flavobacteriaceae bacterium]|nr:chorismate-binding protein [Flavobacteriaceae bacterium]
MSAQNFHKKLQLATDNKRPFVVYKLPDSRILSLLIQKEDTLYTSEKLNESGFVLAPFNTEKKRILIPFEHSDFENFILSPNFIKVNSHKKSLKSSTASLNKTDYTQLIKKAVGHIKNNKFNKVVLSRKTSIKNTEFDLKNTFLRLALKYPNALTYFWHHPKVGTWMGATPEKLISINDNYFETMALAGTQIFKENTAIIWGEKEKKEQQIVIDYISESLKKIGIPIKISKPFNLKAGHMSHICSEITGRLPEKSSLLKLVENLHPTPAVGGYPKQKAIDFIVENENYDREFYTGYLGIINKNLEREGRSTQLFVNLRCMQVDKQKLSFYVGGGITKDSNPQNEWQETEDKSKTLLSVL